jgi:hypothetical protein
MVTAMSSVMGKQSAMAPGLADSALHTRFKMLIAEWVAVAENQAALLGPRCHEAPRPKDFTFDG